MGIREAEEVWLGGKGFSWTSANFCAATGTIFQEAEGDGISESKDIAEISCGRRARITSRVRANTFWAAMSWIRL
jgi:hypothetical protein